MSRTRIKFCGLTRPGDVRLAVELGVDAVGFVFAAGSPRRLEPGQAQALREAVPPPVAVVALFMDTPAADVRRIVRLLQPDLLQFHGSEDEAFCRAFGRPYLKALAMGAGGAPVEQALARYPSASGFLLDGHAPGQAGGSGRRFDWTRARLPGRSVWLAGGLGPGNVAEAIREAQPYAVDVSSGIERAPGIKDGAKMQAFIEEVRRADQGRQ